MCFLASCDKSLDTVKKKAASWLKEIFEGIIKKAAEWGLANNQLVPESVPNNLRYNRIITINTNPTALLSNVLK